MVVLEDPLMMGLVDHATQGLAALATLGLVEQGLNARKCASSFICQQDFIAKVKMLKKLLPVLVL